MYKPFTFLISLIFLLPGCSGDDSSYILNENFDANTIGWTEESTASHSAEIRGGSYFIYSHPEDTNKIQSSVTPLKTSYLAGLPGKYEITSLISRIKAPADMEYGILLYSSSLIYTFAHTKSGEAYVSEYDYNSEKEDTLIHKGYMYRNKTEPVKFSIRVSGRDLQFLLNNFEMGKLKLKTKQWVDYRIYTSAGSEIAVDYFRIQKLR